MQRSSIVKLYLALPGFTVQSLNMGRLYSQRDEFGYLSSNEQLQKR